MENTALMEFIFVGLLLLCLPCTADSSTVTQADSASPSSNTSQSTTETPTTIISQTAATSSSPNSTSTSASTTPLTSLTSATKTSTTAQTEEPTSSPTSTKLSSSTPTTSLISRTSQKSTTKNQTSATTSLPRSTATPSFASTITTSDAKNSSSGPSNIAPANGSSTATKQMSSVSSNAASTNEPSLTTTLMPNVSSKNSSTNGSEVTTAPLPSTSSNSTSTNTSATNPPLPVNTTDVTTDNNPAPTQTVSSNSNGTTVKTTIAVSGNVTSTPGPCDSKACGNGTCEPATGKCSCLDGFNGDACDTDINECSDNTLNNCSTNANCTNNDGSYTCTCTQGWKGDGTVCTDINECSDNTLNNCSTNANCTNNDGSYTCTCTQGWKGDGTVCTDINECSDNTLNNCSTNANCTNNDGSYTCTCTQGWKGDGTVCTDINECSDNTLNNCSTNANCTNNDGSYTCTCTLGWKGDGTVCTDIDECSNKTLNNCSKNAKCSNIDGSYTCTCTGGWQGDGINCTDTDECSETPACHIWANCTNIEGSYNCTCEAGFEGDGHSCTDVDECQSNTTNSCNARNTKQCINIGGNYFCLCQKGWKGNLCNEVDDLCNVALKPCSPNATCSYNTSGVFCECNNQFKGNGTICYRKVLLEQYMKGAKFEGDDGLYGPYHVPGGIPFNGKVYSKIYVSMNGYITLGKRLNMRYPNLISDSTLLNDVDFPVIAPLWADIETNGESGGLFINTNLSISEINSYFGDLAYNPRFAFMATWKFAVPYPYQEFKDSEKADFQVVLLTNGSSTKLILNYDQENFTWKVSPGRKVVIGFSGMDRTWHGLASQDNFTKINGISSDASGVKGRLEFDISPYNKTIEDKRLGESKCFDWLQNISDTDLSEALRHADACPCSIRQAQLDKQFRASKELKYESRFPKGNHDTTQNCKYSPQGALLTGAPNGGFITAPALDIDKGFLHCCEQSSRLCEDFYMKVRSQNCAGYKPPSWTLTWGDPHFYTIDGCNYTFNGRGEFTLMQYTDQDLQELTEVQVRTDYVSENRTNATVFVGLAATLGNNNSLEINLNRTSETLNIFTKEQTINSFDGTTNINLTDNKFMVFNENRTLIVTLKVGISLMVKFSNILDITTSVAKNDKLNGSLKGLLGNNDGNCSNDFVSRNGAEFSSSSNESTLYEFASTWKVSNTTSLFNYSLSGKPFEYYNNESLPDPTFFGEMMNLTEYIIEACGSTIDISACCNDLPCQIDTAATCNITFGITTKQTARDAEKEKKALKHRPPVLKDSAPAILYLGYNFNKTETLTLKEYFKEDNISISVSDVSESLKKVYTYENDTFTLNISSLDRDKHFPYFVKFTAEDDLNATTEYWPSIYYCPCDRKEECDYSQFMESNDLSVRFYVASCNCSDDFIGQYCESKSCNRYNVTAECDAGCPAGMEAVDKGDKCYDIDECERHLCDQICVNTIGDYICNCSDGYTLNGKTKCDDINECDEGDKCQEEGQYCNNIPGNYTCECLPGYRKINGTCNKVTKSFGGELAFKLVYQPCHVHVANFTKSLIKLMLKGVNLTDVEIVNLVEVNGTRRKRDTSEHSKYNTHSVTCNFIVYADTDTRVLVKTFNNSAGKFKVGYKVNGTVFFTQLEKSKMYSDENNGICNIPHQTDCDPVSTNCKTTNGTFRCECKKGFIPVAFSDIRCEDINECGNPTVCPGPIGNCTNTPGSFDCMCTAGFMFEGLNCKDLCQPNPCKNDGKCFPGNIEGEFLCKCDDEWTGKTCETENSEISRLRTIAIAVGASVGCLCLLLLCVMLGMYRRNKARRFGYTRRPISAYDDLSLPHTSDFLKKDMPLDDSNAPDESTFSIPRARLRASEYATIEDKKSTQGMEYDAYAGKDNDDRPLTSSKRHNDDDDDDDNERFGKSNPSFLHRDENDRPQTTNTRRNPYEYF